MLSKGIMSWLTPTRCGDLQAGNPTEARTQPSPAPPWLTKPCAVPDCGALRWGWAGPGSGWRHVSPSTAMHLQPIAAPHRSLTSDVVVVAALTHFLATHLTQLRALSLSPSLPPCGFSAALTFITDSDAFGDPLFNAGLQPKYQWSTPFEIATLPLLLPLCSFLRLVKRAYLDNFKWI